MAREDSPSRAGRDGKHSRPRDSGRSSRRTPSPKSVRSRRPTPHPAFGSRLQDVVSGSSHGSDSEASLSASTIGKHGSNSHKQRGDNRSDPRRVTSGHGRPSDNRRDREKDRHRSNRDRSRSRNRGRQGDRREHRKHSPSRYGRLSRSRSPPPPRRVDRSRSRSPRRRDDRYSRRSPRRSPRPRSPRDRDGKTNDSRPPTRDSRDQRTSAQASPAHVSSKASDREASPPKQKEWHLQTHEERELTAEERRQALRENLTRHLTDRDTKLAEPEPAAEPVVKAKKPAVNLSKKRKILGGDVGPVPPVRNTRLNEPSGSEVLPKISSEPKNTQSNGSNHKPALKFTNLASKEDEDEDHPAGIFGTNDEDVVKKPKFRKLEDETVPLPQQVDEPEGEDEETVFDDLDGEMSGKTYNSRQEYAEKAAKDAAARDQGATGLAQSQPMDVDPAEGEEDDIDPLDAYMRDLSAKPPPAVGLGKKRDSKSSSAKQVASFELEEDDGMTAVETEDVIAAAQARAVKNNKKKLPDIDHKKIDYISFKKDFYREPEELKMMDETDVARLRIQLDKIDVGGRDPPKPVLRWSHFGFSSAMLNILDNDRKFSKPTPIQAQGIPTILSGRDVIGIAKTGSGKTLAYLLPMFRHILDQPALREREGPIGFIVVPTRELAVQVQNECKVWCKATGLKSVAVYGGAPLTDQINAVKSRPQIVIATPGRWIEMLTANAGRLVNHQRTTYVVLDEADRLFDGGFQPQVLKILDQIRPDRQLVIFSATFPKIIEAAALKFLRLPVRITVSGIGVVAPEITQVVEVHEEAMKMRELLRLFGQFELDEDNKALVFVERQEACDEAVRTLRSRGYLAISVHGGKEQIDRQDAIRDFSNGTFLVLVATSVAARGLDVRDLKLVVNFDAPNHLEDYVHRAGRTGRAGKTGTAVTFISPEEGRFAASIITALEASSQEVPEALRKLHDRHQEEVKSGKIKKEAQKVYDGFNEGNKGLGALDYRHRQAQKEEQKHWRKEFKDLGGDELPDEPEEDDEEKRKKPASSEKPANPADSDEPIDYLQQLMNKVDQADMTVRKTERTEQAPPKLSAKERAEAAGGAINARLRQGGSIRGTAPIDNKGPDAGAFHATLEINDFPQKARWSVTNRSNVAKILESTGASITNKGNFYAPGAPRPGPTEQPPLYILVEGDTELQVKQAMNDLKELLKAGIQADAQADARVVAASAAPSRYKVT